MQPNVKVKMSMPEEVTDFWSRPVCSETTKQPE